MADIQLMNKPKKRVESTDGKYKLYILNRPSDTTYVIPLLWATAKTYYETHGKHREDWSWANPKVDYSDAEKLARTIADDNPKAIGFSVYMWNEQFNITVAKILKDLLPSCVVLWGGPQCDIEFNDKFFQQHPYIDVVIPGDAYGEVSFCNILDNIADNNGTLDGKSLPYAYYPGLSRERLFNERSSKKRDFEWPENPFRAQEKHIKPFIDELHDNNNQVRLMVETSRGCPYKCSFCDWGGGTYTKTVKKPMATVYDEITWCAENKIDMISLTDANFGIYEIDIDYARHLADMKRKYGYPKVIHINGPTKVKLKNLMRVYEELADADMIPHYQISIQDINEDIKKNVDRIDFAFSDQVEMFRKLQKRKHLPIHIECILGLPGATIDTMKQGIDEISQTGLQYPIHYPWAMLPATPANDPEFRKRFELKTVKGKSSSGLGPPHVLASKPGVEPDPGLYLLRDDKEIASEYIVGTFSYSDKDWVDMALLMLFTSQMQNSGLLKLLNDYLHIEHDIKYGDFLYECLQTILHDDNVDLELKSRYHKSYNRFHEWINTNALDLYIDPGEGFNLRLSPAIFFNYSSLLDVDAFYDAIIIATRKIIDLDDKILDLIKFSKERMLDFDYTVGKTFTTQYDWQKYEEEAVLEETNPTYQINDTGVFTGGTYFPLDWLEHEGVRRHKEYIYKFCYDFKSTKAARKLTRLR